MKIVVSGRVKVADSPLKHAPHTMDMVMAETWPYVYSRQQAAFPVPWCNPARWVHKSSSSSSSLRRFFYL